MSGNGEVIDVKALLAKGKKVVKMKQVLLHKADQGTWVEVEGWAIQLKKSLTAKERGDDSFDWVIKRKDEIADRIISAKWKTWLVVCALYGTRVADDRASGELRARDKVYRDRLTYFNILVKDRLKALGGGAQAFAPKEEKDGFEAVLKEVKSASRAHADAMRELAVRQKEERAAKEEEYRETIRRVGAYYLEPVLVETQSDLSAVDETIIALLEARMAQAITMEEYAKAVSQVKGEELRRQRELAWEQWGKKVETPTTPRGTVAPPPAVKKKGKGRKGNSSPPKPRNLAGLKLPDAPESPPDKKSND